MRSPRVGLEKCDIIPAAVGVSKSPFVFRSRSITVTTTITTRSILIIKNTMLPQSDKSLRVAIIGAGPGGLVLAQLLRDDPRFDVTVYERGSPEVKGASLTGYRILITPDILDSLRSQLPADVQALLDKAVGLSQPNGNRMCFMDEMCQVKCRLDVPASRNMLSISRWKLRRALLSRSSDFVQFGRAFTSYEVDGVDGVKVSFADGESIHCDLLVGADGAGSRVRKQLLPDSGRSSTDVTVIYFKAPFTPETEAMIPWESGVLVILFISC